MFIKIAMLMSGLCLVTACTVTPAYVAVTQPAVVVPAVAVESSPPARRPPGPQKGLVWAPGATHLPTVSWGRRVRAAEVASRATSRQRQPKQVILRKYGTAWARGSPHPVIVSMARRCPADLPAGATLASSPLCTSQAFRYGDRVYGLLFHLE
jgi:hypothetical protein